MGVAITLTGSDVEGDSLEFIVLTLPRKGATLTRSDTRGGGERLLPGLVTAGCG